MTGPLDHAVARADAARDARRWREAAKGYAEALRLAPKRADLHVQHGHALKESGDAQGAEVAYRRALDLAPDVADTWMQLGHLMAVTGRRDAAAEAYAQAVLRDRDLSDAQTGLRAALAAGGSLADDLRARVARAVRPAGRARALLSDDAEVLERRLQAAIDRLDESADPSAVAALRAGLEALRGLSPPTPAGLPVTFDVSDLIGYFAHSRLPTGIQRVQIELISALLLDPEVEPRVRVCAFDEARDDWVQVPSGMFLDLAEDALADGDLEQPGWKARLAALRTEFLLAPALSFTAGEWLVNLGTSWWLQNYFLKVREAKRRHGVRYVPFVHDMIPVMTPEHCVRPLVRDFVGWVRGVFDHADAFLTNSEASRADLLEVAGRLGREAPAEMIRVVRLDADFRRPGRQVGDAVLQRLGVTAGGYILFVSTIESRKNHIEVLTALQRMLRDHGSERTPKLVCVGGKGWLNDAVFARLASDGRLARHVLMVHGLPDAELDALYRHSRFTVYPSLIEGWGLPVTESLCHGKAVLASNRSSVPEAGGDLAVYFKPGDLEGLTEAMERLTFDDGWRDHLERRIVERFRPRQWRDLGRDVVSALDAWSGPEPVPAPEWPRARPGRLHRLGRSLALGIGPDGGSDEIFRDGLGWAPPEDWGCRARGSGADLVFGLDFPKGARLRLHLGLRAMGEGLAYVVEVGGDRPVGGFVLAGAVRWQILDLEAPGVGTPIRVRLSAMPDGRDLRAGERIEIGVIGFMVCAADDLSARADFQAGIASGGWGFQPPDNAIK